MLIELSPSSYNKLLTNRPDEIATVNAAVCQEPATLHYVEAEPAVSGIWEHAAKSFKDRWWGDLLIEQLPVVECLPMTALIEKNIGGDPRVCDSNGRCFFDFFSLDVEGSEWAVLQSIDWSTTAFGVIVLEADENFLGRNEVIVSFLRSKGYLHLHHDLVNNWFIH